MGAFHMSQVVFGAEPGEVRLRLVRWLRAKGFELQPGEPLVALHPKHERGLILKHTGAATVVLYSELAEQPRLLFELQRVGRAVLDTWMHDSDLWGYQLHEGGQCVSAFSSNPRYFGAAEDPPGPDDLEALARISGRSAGELRRARKTRALFAEGLHEQFLAALGVRGAATQYGYHREDGMRPGLDEGLDVEHLWFRREGHDPLEKLDLTTLDFAAPPADARPGAMAQLTEEQLAQAQALQARAARQARLMQLVFWPVGLVFRVLFGPWLWWRQRALRRQLEALAPDDGVAGQAPASPVVERPDGRLYDPRLGASVRLPEGAVREEVDRLDLGPAHPFSCHLAGHRLALRAVSTQEVRGLARFSPPGCETVQELDFSSGRPVKVVRQRFAAPHDGWRVVALVKGPRAVFMGESGGQGDPPPGLAEAVVGLVRSLRFEAEQPGETEE